MVALSCDHSRWLYPGGYSPPSRVPHSLVALAQSLRRATGQALRSNGPRHSRQARVARRKRSAPAKHSVRSADGGTQARAGSCVPAILFGMSIAYRLAWFDVYDFSWKARSIKGR